MSLGVVMLVHTALHRAEQVIRHWSAAGCPVVVHVDLSVERSIHDAFVQSLSDLPAVEFSTRYRCEWGTWGLVAAAQAASEQLLRHFPSVRHVYLASGACLPLRPVADLQDYLAARPRTDFIESATTADVPWTIGGLDEERFTLRFPFSFRRQRFLFDRFVELQRRFKLHRRVPEGIVPHMGSQWWCLTRQTLSAILEDPDRPTYDRYFRHVWIPDESYFQTLARLYSRNIESRSLTLSKFDYQGKPHIFYDDHLQLLRRSDCFVARKIWPRADLLYDTFLTSANPMRGTEPNPGKIDRVFSRAVERRTRGRAGLFMQSRLPREGHENGFTAAPYSVFEGFTELFEDFEPWLARNTDTRVHGHLFAPEGAQFDGRQRTFAGGLCDNPRLRDYNARMFLTNLVWNTRGERQCFQFGPRDSQLIIDDVARDPNARISVITGAWSIPLFLSNRNFSVIRADAAALQRVEAAHLAVLRAHWAKARVRILTLAEFVESPMEALQTVLDDMSPEARRGVTEAPRMVDLTGFAQFLQNLKNQGMHPYMMGDFPSDPGPQHPRGQQRKPYIVR